ncbi:MAG: 2'-5' RNA ligase family protein [Bacteroidia bacterium]|nr:2'-5' RNA ligase family protein [Bacteroidia bacterium]
MATRQQLTLFLDPLEAAPIEHIRKTYNTIQYGLIKSHVTLCREDEIKQIHKVLENLKGLSYPKLELSLGKAERFSEGKGVFVPVIDLNQSFRNLRIKILTGIIEKPREHQAHITLMHPRNSSCTDSQFSEILDIKLPARITLSTISLIEQEIGQKWQILEVFQLPGS